MAHSEEQAVSRRRMRVIYRGRVQGVGFRYTAKSVANGFVVVGTIQNLPNGGVELIIEGDKQELEEFRAAILDSAVRHFIDTEEVHWSEALNQFRGFEIIK